MSTSSTTVELQDAAAALEHNARKGNAPSGADCFGQILRNPAALQAAMRALRQPGERIEHRLLWFKAPFCLQPDQCAGPWPRLQPPESAHETALGALVAAYLSASLPRIVAALTAWHAFLEQPEYWHLLEESERQAHSESAASPADLLHLRTHAMSLAAEPLTAAAEEARARQDTSLPDYLATLEQLEPTGAWARSSSEPLRLPLVAHRPAQKARAAEANVSAAREATEQLQQHLRTLASWSERVIEDETHTLENRRVASEELLFFRSRVAPCLEKATGLLGAATFQARALRSEVARALAGIAAHHFWARVSHTADSLLAEAMQLDPGPGADLLLQNDRHRRQRAGRGRKDEPARKPPRRQTAAATTAPPPHLPHFFRSSWRLGVTVAVFSFFILACLLGAENFRLRQSAARLRALHPAPDVPHDAPRSTAESRNHDSPVQDAGLITVDPLPPHPAALLARIRSEQHAASQMERQLAPLRREMMLMSSSSTDLSHPNPTLIEINGIYQRLSERQRIIVAQWKQDQKSYDLIVRGRMALTSSESTKKNK